MPIRLVPLAVCVSIAVATPALADETPQRWGANLLATASILGPYDLEAEGNYLVPGILWDRLAVSLVVDSPPVGVGSAAMFGVSPGVKAYLFNQGLFRPFVGVGAMLAWSSVPKSVVTVGDDTTVGAKTLAFGVGPSLRLGTDIMVTEHWGGTLQAEFNNGVRFALGARASF